MAELMLKRFATGKKNAIRKIIQQANVPPLLIKRTFFLPKSSDHLPRMGSPINWNAGYIADSKP